MITAFELELDEQEVDLLQEAISFYRTHKIEAKNEAKEKWLYEILKSEIKLLSKIDNKISEAIKE